MIFKPELVEKILAGEKTQTRRRSGGGSCRYHPGRSYAVQPGRGEPAVARILVRGYRGEDLLVISEDDAMAEGFEDREAFLAYWDRLYGNSRDVHVWVIDFELEPEEADA